MRKAINIPKNFPNAFSILLPKLNLRYFCIYKFLVSCMSFYKASSQPYNLTNVIPSIIYRVVWILLSRWMFISCTISPFFFEIHLERGMLIIIRITERNPGHPSLRQSKIADPIPDMGNTNAFKNVRRRCSTTLRSLESKLLILPTSDDLILCEVSHDTLLQSRITNELLILADRRLECRYPCCLQTSLRYQVKQTIPE